MRTYIADQIPYHIQADQLGADIRAIKNAKLGNADAATIRATWDYRAAGLSVDQARECITRWTNRPYRFPAPIPASGRYLSMLRSLRCARTQYADFVAARIPGEAITPTWNNYRVTWAAADRVLVTTRNESAEWGRKNGRYPTKTEVSYTTSLLRADWQTTPHARELLSTPFSPIQLATEATIGHDARGNWQQRALDELLPGAKPAPSIDICYKRVAIDGGLLASIFAGTDTTYDIGRDTHSRIIRDRHSGIFVQPTPEAAEKARVPDTSVLADAPFAILACECWGKSHDYGNKIAYEHCRPVEIIAYSLEADNAA